MAWGDLGRLPITEHRDLKALGLLAVALVEEFFEKEVGPDGTQIELSQRSTDIAGVNEAITHQLLTSLNCLFAGRVNELVGVVAALDFELRQMISQLASEFFHEGHVGADDCLQNALSEELDVLLRMLFGDEVVFVDIEQFDSFSGVVALLNADLAVHLVALGVGHHVVSIIKPIMLHVVAEGGHQESQGVKIVELGKF